MSTHNIDLTADLDQFVHDRVASGQYEDAGEVIRAALRRMEREEQRFESEIATLRAAIDAGDASGIAEGDVPARARRKFALPVKTS